MQEQRQGLIDKAKTELDTLIWQLQLQQGYLNNGKVHHAPMLNFNQYQEAVTNILFFDRVSDFFTLTPKHEGK